MRRFLLPAMATIISLLGLPGARASGLNIDHPYGDKIGGWTIGYSDTFEGCLAAATYVDQTTMWLGLGGDRLGAYLAFTNPSWRWIEVGKEYHLELNTAPYASWAEKALAIERMEKKDSY
jgi:serine protease Do